MPSFFDMQKYAATGIASPDMTAYDKARALSLFSGRKTQTLTDVPPLSFRANGKPLISWLMLGNGQQTGTPTPDAPIMPEFVGTLSGSEWTLPITCGEQTHTVDLGQVQTVRRIKKLVLTGTEAWYAASTTQGNTRFTKGGVLDANTDARSNILCTHLVYNPDYNYVCVFITASLNMSITMPGEMATVDFKAYLAAQLAAGTPVTVWYVLAEPETGIINEPLCGIGDYADELSSTDAGVSIPTAKGQNTLTVEGDLPPSEMTITYYEEV